MAIRKFLAFCGQDIQLRVEQVAKHRWRDCLIPVTLFRASQEMGVPVVVPWMCADTEEACKRAVVERAQREFGESPNSDGWWDLSEWTDQEWRAEINRACGGDAYREYEAEEPKPAKPKVHRVLSIRDNQADERLIEEAWKSEPDIEISHVDCGIQALEYLHVPELQLPNLILLAWRFQENQLTAIEILIELKVDLRFRPIPVVVLAGALSPYSVEDLYMNHVACVIEFGDSFDALVRNLRTVRDLWLKGAGLPYSAQVLPAGQASLTEREKEILRWTAEDLAAKEIADRLHISSRTVEFHRDSIKRRLGVQGTAGMIKYAIKSGLVSL